MDEITQTIDVEGYTFTVTPQDGCISQCLILQDGQAPPMDMDALANMAIEKREQGEFILTEDGESGT